MDPYVDGKYVIFKREDFERWQREFNAHGVMQRRYASINDMPITQRGRKFHWSLGKRPEEHPGFSELELYLQRTDATGLNIAARCPCAAATKLSWLALHRSVSAWSDGRPTAGGR